VHQHASKEARSSEHGIWSGGIRSQTMMVVDMYRVKLDVHIVPHADRCEHFTDAGPVPLNILHCTVLAKRDRSR
jgi:hypothetical protein